MTLSPLWKIGQDSSYSPKRLISPSATLQGIFVQGCKRAKHKTYHTLDDHWVKLTSSKAFHYSRARRDEIRWREDIMANICKTRYSYSSYQFLIYIKESKNLKGHRHDRWCLFTISFFPKLLYISSMKPSQNRTTIFKLIVHVIELHAAFDERENKKRTLNFNLNFLELSFFSHKNALVMQFYGKRKITLNYAMFINCSCKCLQIKTFMNDFSSVYCSILSRMVCTFLDDFL